MNGFAALDIHPYRRYVVDIGGRRSSRCRLHINFALFLHSLDFTQNLGVTHIYETRNAAANGHETLDTDASALAAAAGDLACERYVLSKGKLQVEVLCNLDQVPPAGAIAFAVCPPAKIGTQAPSARCLSTTLPEFEHHFPTTKLQSLIIGLAQSSCD